MTPPVPSPPRPARRTLLVLRPDPGAAATVAAAAAIGLTTIAAPLFAYRAIGWTLPDPLPDAVLMTSAAAARLGGPGLAALHDRPVYAVGRATAAAARAAGFTSVLAGDGDVAAIVARAEADGVATLLHLAGREHRPPEGPIPIERRIVYAADAVDALAIEPAGHVALLHSPRAAALFAGLVPDRATVRIAALSAAVAAAAGPGWDAVAVAAAPTDAALLAAAARLCDQGEDQGGTGA